MEYIIKNEFLKATILSHGAELIKLVDSDGVNRLHTPSADTWNRVSPILFPQVSRIPNSEYKVNGKIYKMPMHGFIRESELELVNQTDTEITFMYHYSEKSLQIYPYAFLFYVTYKLVENTLEVSFKIENPSNEVLRYMLGGHPGFKVPLYDDELFSDYYVEFEKNEITKRMVLVENFLADKYEDYVLDTIDLNHKLFSDDALIFRNINSNYVDIISKNHNKKIRFHFGGFEILAIWSKPEEHVNFVCLEPWNGIQKNFVKDHENMGVLEVKPKSESYFSYKIEVI